jgi:acyl carrier protein
MEKPTNQEINAWLVTKLSQGLNIPAEQIDTRKPFVQYGLDSISAFILMGQLENRFGCEIHPEIFSEYPNAESLSRYLEDKIQEKIKTTLS